MIADENLILQSVGRNILFYFPRQVHLVFGTALIWAVYDDDITKLVDSKKIKRIKTIINTLTRNMELGTNLVKKVPLVVTGSGRHLLIDKYATDDGNTYQQELIMTHHL